MSIPKYKKSVLTYGCVVLIGVIFMGFPCLNAQMSAAPDLGPSTLGLEKGTSAFKTAQFQLEILNSSQTVTALKTNDAEPFDYTPGDRLKQRDKNGFYHLGDITLGLRQEGSADWSYFSSSKNRTDVVAVKPDNQNVFAIADLSKTLPQGLPVQVLRFWEKDGDNIVMRFEIRNKSDKAVEIGALGIPMVFNNNFNDKSLEQAHNESVFFDPYIGKDAGYLQVVRLHGKGKVMLVVPYGNTPFEAYRPLTDEPMRSGYTFEGLHEWMVHSKSYAETTWKGAEQWNIPTSAILKPGESRSYGVKFLFAGSVRDIEKTLAAANRPVAVGLPGYVLPMDVDGKLFLQYKGAVKNITVEPQGAIEFKEMPATKQGWKNYALKGKIWGRARVTVDYADGLSQTINYKVIYPEKEVIASYGKFLTTKQWYDNKNDTFNRAPSVLSYDYETKQHITQNSYVWMAGLSDEAGAGSWLGAIMKQVVLPEKEEVAKLEDFVNQTIWAGIQYSEGPEKYGVRKSLFYYEPDSMPEGTYDKNIKWGEYGGFPSWSRKEAKSVGRSYNYPHVAAAHWAMYRLARYHKGLVSQQNWKWYLENAFQTVMAMVELAPYYARHGQMEGTIFTLILRDLKSEGLTAMASEMEALMKTRMQHWITLSYPFESEMPWDSTGQEEVFMWAKYFGIDEKAMVTLNAILAYMPTVPHWAYNGNARRFWDFHFAGKTKGFERMIHHYGSAMNAIPVLYQYREQPSDFYLLRVGYGGLLGAISNITQDGFAPCAFHSFPWLLRNDAYSGDYGCGFLGYTLNTSTFITYHDEFGWVAFGGNCTQKNDWVNTELTTAARSKVFVAPAGLWLTLDAGKFRSVSYNHKTGTVKVELEKADAFTPTAYLHVITTAKTVAFQPMGIQRNAKGVYEIPLKSEVVGVTIKQ